MDTDATRRSGRHGNGKQKEVYDRDDDDVDEGDPLVREINVYLSPALSKQIYLMQYPGQPVVDAVEETHRSRHPNENDSFAFASASAATSVVSLQDELCSPMAARIKPRHGVVEAEHSVRGHTTTHAAATATTSTRTFESQTIPVTTHLCLGKIRIVPADAVQLPGMDSRGVPQEAAELHLIPLTHITQMRPSFAKVRSDLRSNNTNDDEDDDDAMMEDLNNNTVKNEFGGTDHQQPIGFTRKETDRAAAARKSSYAYKQASQDGEAWIDLRVSSSHFQHDSDSNDVDLAGRTEDDALRAQISCPKPHQSIWETISQSNNEAKDEYIHSLNYLSVTTGGNPMPTSDNLHPLSSSQAAVSDTSRMKRLVANLTLVLQRTGGPIPFSILCSQFVDNNSATTTTTTTTTTIPVLIEALNVCAVLVRGNWCLHSKFLVIKQQQQQYVAATARYRNTPVVNDTATLQRIRTFLLLLLETESAIDRSRLLRVFGADADSSSFPSSRSTTARISPHRLLALLELVAKKQGATAEATAVGNSRNSWVLKIEDDEKFLQRYSDTAALHAAYWRRQRNRFSQELQTYHKTTMEYII